jgi:dihydroorotase
LRPHFYCLPILKRESHRLALVEAATVRAIPRFFLGTDSAPHPRHAKEAACCGAGCYSAPDRACALRRGVRPRRRARQAAGFRKRFGADFYGLARNEETITLVRDATPVPHAYPYGDDTLVPLCAGETVAWRIPTA